MKDKIFAPMYDDRTCLSESCFGIYLYELVGKIESYHTSENLADIILVKWMNE